MSIQQKILSAQLRIRRTVEFYGINRVYAAYSGGKDSKAVLALCRSIYPNILAIHNCHEGENIDPDTPGVLSVKMPKKENVPAFLKTVDLAAQFDGTRKDEDKTVIFDNKEIHRSQTPTWWTDLGVFGLHTCFPLWDWTEENVYEYLETISPISVDNLHISFEGEGPMIGTKTLFCRYPAQDRISWSEKAVSTALKAADAIYLTASKLTPALGAWAANMGKPVTIEVPEPEWYWLDAPNVTYFIVCDGTALNPSLFNNMPNPKIFIKIRILNQAEFPRKIALANKFADRGHTVLLMPESVIPTIDEVGQVMMHHINDLMPNVRLMPPVQKLIGIK